ncbi:MAG: aldo/keto reductase [Phycisphaeraceae bacterium]|nr:MAG: aldo/keto reductase [Phycisphaeraceae bacterium]
MQYTKIRGIEREVSRVAFGCMSTVPSIIYSGLEADDAVATMRRAFDLGINFFDTARAYADGESERQLGEAIRGIRDEVVIASKPKAGDLSASEIAGECEQSLRDLGVDRIDLYQIHWPKRVVPLEETARAMETLVEQGKVGAIGVCNFGPTDLDEWLGLAPCATDQIAYNMIFRGCEFTLRERCTAANVGILCYSPLGQGLLAGRYETADDVPVGKARTRHFSDERPDARHGQPGFESETFAAIAAIKSIAEREGLPMGDLALAWLLHQPAVSAVLAGASRPDQVERNVRAAEVTLSPAVLNELDDATAVVKEKLGPSIDMWQVPPRTA